MALIGNGSQSEFQTIAFMTQLGIRERRVFDVDGVLKIVCAASIREAVWGADIVTTADKTNATILTDDLVPPLRDPKDLFGCASAARRPLRKAA